MVNRRVVLSEAVRDGKPDGVLEQDSFGSHQAEVGSVSSSRVVIHTYLLGFFRLPELAEELQSLLKQTELRLRGLPKPPSDNPISEIIEMVSGFSRSLSTFVEGTPDEHGIHQVVQPLHIKFKDAIRETAPDFRPYKSGEWMNYEPPTFLAAEKTEVGPDESAIYVDQVMNMALR